MTLDVTVDIRLSEPGRVAREDTTCQTAPRELPKWLTGLPVRRDNDMASWQEAAGYHGR